MGKKIEKLRPGQVVEWTSSASGVTKTKSGTVLFFIEKGTTPGLPRGDEALFKLLKAYDLDVKRYRDLVMKMRLYCDPWVVSASNDRYAVLVPPETLRQMPKLYLPRAVDLNKVD